MEPSFNEAGAHTLRIGWAGSGGHSRWRCFNEAGAHTPRIALVMGKK